LLLPFNTLAQEKPNSPVLVDDFGRLQVSQLIARLGVAVNEFQNQPDAKIFLINYRSYLELPGASSRFLNGMKQYIVRSLRISPKQIILIDGGEVSCRTTQVWIAPAGTAPKATITPYQTAFPDTYSTRKFDEYYYPYSEDFQYDDYSYGFNSVNSLGAFVEAVKKERGTQAYVIVYPQYYIERIEEQDKRGKTTTRSRIHLDSANTVAKMQKEIRNELVNTYNLSFARVKIVNGGYRNLRQVELWILPRGEHAPIATPNAFPKINRKTRKK
ncbi:MAG: hypothetical protein ABI954_02590, partial [Pyrinomonadaceae bacterium]